MFSLNSLGLEATTIKALFIAYFVFGLFIAFVSILLYVLEAIGIYEMSKTAGFKNSWYSFVPFFNVFSLGRLADFKSRKKTLGKALLILYIVFFVLYICGLVGMILSVIDVIFKADSALYNEASLDISVLKSLIFPIVLLLISCALALVYQVLVYVSLWKIYSTFAKENAVLYLVLSIFFGFLPPIFLFIIRKNSIVSFDYMLGTNQNGDNI